MFLVLGVLILLSFGAFPDYMKKEHGKSVRWQCERCGRKFSKGWMLEFHHILPTNAGGKDTWDNIELLCLEHHYYAHVDLRSRGLDHPNSATLVYERWQRKGGRR